MASSTSTGVDLQQLIKSLSTLVNLVTVKLTGSNYLLWKKQFIPLFNGYKLMGYLDGSIPQPFSTNAQASFQWKQIDQLLISWLFSTITEDVLPEIAGLSTAKEVWDSLNQIFIQRHRMPEIELGQKTQSRRKGTTSMSNYIKQFKHLCDELDAIEKPLKDDDKVSWILKGMDRNCNVVLTNI